MTQPDAALPADLQAELVNAVLRAKRKAYMTGWYYGVLCGLLCGSMTTGLGVVLLHLVSGAFAEAAAQPLTILPVLTT
jgi:hypothetical protein